MFDTDTNQPTQTAEPPQGWLGKILNKTVKKFTVEILGEDDIPAILALQEKVVDTIPPDKKHYLKKRDEDDVLCHMGHRMPVIGIKDECGKLVAQCFLSYPSRGEAVKNIGGYPLNDHKCTTAIIQSLAVDPDMRGHKLATQTINAAKEIARMSGHVIVLAKVAQDNTPSTKSFMNAAFTKASEGLDPVKHYPVNYWQHNLYQGCTASPQCMAK